MPSTGDFSVRSTDAALQILDDQPLAVALEPARLELELEAFFLQPGVLDRVLVIEARGGQVVARLLEVALADGLRLPGILGALELALGRLDVDFGEVAWSAGW